MGKEEQLKKYGLLQFLEFQLNRRYGNCNRTGELEYIKLKQLKDRINIIKKEILESVKIRARIQEQLEGEKVSNYLISKQTTLT